MNHKENYGKVLNTLATITTKGKDTLTMATCINFLSQCIQECEQAEAEQTTE